MTISSVPSRGPTAHWPAMRRTIARYCTAKGRWNTQRPRFALECRPDADGQYRLDAQLCADVLGEKILHWSPSPAEAYQIAVRLNDKYQLDGRDPTVHRDCVVDVGKFDRPWFERPIFGQIRYMSARALKEVRQQKIHSAEFGAIVAACVTESHRQDCRS